MIFSSRINLHLVSSFSNLLLILQLPVYHVNSQQPEVSLQMFLDLQARVSTNEAVQATAQNQINQLTIRIQNQEARQDQDMAQINARVANLQGQVNRIEQDVQDLAIGLSVANGKISALERNVQENTDRIEKLENVNKIWRANFQVVNRTFAELRKKIKFVAPIIRLPVVLVAG